MVPTSSQKLINRDDFGAGFGRDIASQIHVQLTGNLKVVGSPRIAHRVVKIHSAAARNGDEWIRFRRIAPEFHWRQMESRQGADDF